MLPQQETTGSSAHSPQPHIHHSKISWKIASAKAHFMVSDGTASLPAVAVDGV